MNARIKDGTEVKCIGPSGTVFMGVVVGWDVRSNQYRIRHGNAAAWDLWDASMVTPAVLELEPIVNLPNDGVTINFCPRDPWVRRSGF